MTENDLSKLGELIQRSLAPLQERLEKIEKTTIEVQKEDERSELDILKEKLNKAESQIQRMIETPVRQGYQYKVARGGEEARTVFSELIKETRSFGIGENTANVIERQQDRLVDPKTTASELSNMLSEALRAADIDGLLK